MAEVNVRINNQSYAISCDDGQEQHVLKLARQVDAKVQEIRQASGASDANHLLVLAAIITANDLHDVQPHVADLKKHIKAQDDALRQAASDIAVLQAQVQSSDNDHPYDLPQTAITEEQLQKVGEHITHLSDRVVALANRIKALA